MRCACARAAQRAAPRCCAPHYGLHCAETFITPLLFAIIAIRHYAIVATSCHYASAIRHYLRHYIRHYYIYVHATPRYATHAARERAPRARTPRCAPRHAHCHVHARAARRMPPCCLRRYADAAIRHAACCWRAVYERARAAKSIYIYAMPYTPAAWRAALRICLLLTLMPCHAVMPL